jgi:hypothetical protein
MKLILKSPKIRMQYLLTRLTCLAVATQLMAGCSMLEILQPGVPTSDQASLQTQRTEHAAQALLELEDIDTLIRLDNDWLEEQISAELTSQASATGKYSFRRLKLNFIRQTISIDASIDINDQQGNVLSASADGEILLDFSGEHLEWLPHFSNFQVNSRNFMFEDGTYAEPVPELTQTLYRSLSGDVIGAIIERGDNTIPLSAVPLGEVEAGASLPGFSNLPAMQSHALRGVFMVAGSAMLIDSSTSAIALDMTFIPDLSTCPADVVVSRAEFASDIASREPAGVVRQLGSTADVQYFFSEISGAKRPLIIVHYWFADGLPVSAEELAVGPSERWRTWSSKGAISGDVRRWEVLVVEKESGCILHSNTVRIPAPETTSVPTDTAAARKAFTAYKEQFGLRTAAFTIAEDQPIIAQVEVQRQFFREVLQAALADLNIVANFDSSAFAALRFTAELLPIDVADVVCEHRDCPPPPACKTVVTQCKRLRDTRDCSSCKFRNPLNNRCVSEAIDPLCEASRNRQNAKYEADRAACIAEAEAARIECNQLAAQAVESCQIESGFEGSACESSKAAMQSLQAGASRSRVSAQTRAGGKLTTNFSNFRIEGDLEGLKLDMTLKSDLQLEGTLAFRPDGIDPPLAECIAAWSAPFKNRFATIPAVNNLLADLQESGDALTANWSGFGLNIDTNPSPLESVFVGNPQLLANCKIGLTVSEVEQAISGDDAEFFTGNIELEIRPLPTIIRLDPATLLSGGNVHTGEAKLSDRHLRYDLGN